MTRTSIKEKREKVNERQKTRRAERKAKGLCTRCGEVKVDHIRFTTCDTCRAQQRVPRQIVYQAPESQKPSDADRIVTAITAALPNYFFKTSHIRAMTTAAEIELNRIRNEDQT